MQKTSFPVEILVGEDESTDGTREICERYAAQYPDKIRLFLRDRKDVMMIMGQATGRANLQRLMQEARGKYVALCEGDDYWIDPMKLQHQVGAMEADQLSAACFTGAWRETDGNRSLFYDGRFATTPAGSVELTDFLVGQAIPLCTVLVRRGLLFPLPEQWYVAPGGDTVLWVHLLRKGPFTFLPEVTAVYRVHPGGIFSMRRASHKLRARIMNLQLVETMVGEPYGALVATRLRKLLLQGWDVSQKEHDTELARLTWKGLLKHRSWAGWNLATTTRNFGKAYIPKVEKYLSRILESKG